MLRPFLRDNKLNGHFLGCRVNPCPATYVCARFSELGSEMKGYGRPASSGWAIFLAHSISAKLYANVGELRSDSGRESDL